MTWRSWSGLAMRESRGAWGRLVFFGACLAVGVAAVVAVAALSQALDATIRAQARQLLAADLAVTSRRPIPAETLAAIDALPGASRAGVQELPSVVSVPAAAGEAADSQLCELKAVSSGYPFYGTLELDPPGPIEGRLAADTVFVGPELLGRLALEIGDTLQIGAARFRVAGRVLREPDRAGVSFTLGPRVLLSRDGLARTELTGQGSRVEHRTLVRLAEGTDAVGVRSAAALVRAAIAEPEFVDVETYLEAQPALRRGLSDAERFLGLVALLSLVVGGIGVAQAVRAWLAGRLDAIAVLRALGVRPWETFALYLGQTLVLALFAGAAGALAGVVVAQLLSSLVSGFLSVRFEVGWPVSAMLRGVALGVGVAAVFALRPLGEVLRVPPLRVLRRDAEPLPLSQVAAALSFGLLTCGIVGAAAIQSASLRTGAQFALGLLLAAGVLGGAARLLVRTLGRLRATRGPLVVRQGVSAVARPGAGTVGAIVALGLGVVVVVGMYLVERSLSARLAADLPTRAPSVFLLDIQPDQWPGVRAVLDGAGAEGLESVEVVVARLRAVDGVPVSKLVPSRGTGSTEQDDGRRRWVFTREQRLTSRARLPEDNVIVAGALWSDPSHAEVSVERDFAADLGVGVGSSLSFDVQGVPIELRVTSLRSVEWESFALNFFLVVEPGVLDGAPRFRVATARLERDLEARVQNRLAAAFPNVTMLRVREVLEQVMAILEQVGRGVRLLGSFTVLAGIAILGGSVTATAARRRREVALYKTLGMTRGQVVATFAVEYALAGAVAGAIGAAGGAVLSWTVARFGFDLAWEPSAAAFAAAIGGTIGLSILGGLAASLRALAVRPLETLRAAD